jgi:hypothetical protein
MEKIQRDRLAETKRSGITGSLATLSGRDLFTFNPALFVDDAGAAEEVDYQEEEDYWNTITKQNQTILDNANEKAILKNSLVEQKQSDLMNCKKTGKRVKILKSATYVLQQIMFKIREASRKFLSPNHLYFSTEMFL